MEKRINLIGTSVLLFTLFSFILIDKNATRFSKDAAKKEGAAFKQVSSSLIEVGLDKSGQRKPPVRK